MTAERAAEAGGISLSRLATRLARPVLGLVAIFSAALCGWKLLDALLYAPINRDAGCYLSIVERMIEGWLPFRDIVFGYTPLGIYVLYWTRELAGFIDDSYSVYLGTVLLLECATGWLIYRISRLYAAPPELGLLLGAVFVAGCLIHEGSFVFLEPFVTFFTCASLLVFFRDRDNDKSTLLCGALAGSAFLSKQYGIASLVAPGVCLLFSGFAFKLILRRLVLLGAGFIAPLSTMLLYYGLLYGIDPVSIVKQFWLPGYVNQVSGMTWLIHFFFYRNVYLLLVPPLFLFRSFRTDPLFLGLTSALLAFGLTAAVRDYGHYCILFMPYGILLGGYLAVKFGRSRRFIVKLLALGVVAGLLPMVWECFNIAQFEKNPSERDLQHLVAAKVHRFLPPRSRVLLFGEPWLNFTGSFYPVANWTGTYGFLSNRSVPELEQAIKASCNIVVDIENTNYFEPERKRIEAETGRDFFDLLRDSGHQLEQTIDGQLQLWLKPCET